MMKEMKKMMKKKVKKKNEIKRKRKGKKRKIEILWVLIFSVNFVQEYKMFQ